MAEGSDLLEFRKPTGPLLLVSLPLSAIWFACLAAPMATAAPRLATNGLLGALTLSLVAMGWPQRSRIIVDENGSVFDAAAQRPLLKGIVALGVTSAEDNSRGSSSEFRLMASGSQNERVVLFADENPGKVLSVATRLASRLGLLVDVPLLATGAIFPSCWRLSPRIPSAPVDVFHRAPTYPRQTLWLSCAGGLFIFSVLGSITHSHWLKDAAFPTPSLLLAALLSGIAAWLLHLGLTTRLWHDSATLSGTGETNCSIHRCGTWGLFGRRVLATWNDHSPPLGLISAAVDAVWLVFADDPTGIKASRISLAGPIPTQLPATIEATPTLQNGDEPGTTFAAR